MKKYCVRCKRYHERSNFNKNRVSRDGLAAYCKPCNAAYQVKWKSEGGDTRLKQRQRNRRKHRMQRIYGLSPADVWVLEQDSDGRCQACGDEESDLHVDHDHETGLVRGLLCQQCNLGLGCAKDSAARLLALVAYINEPPAYRLGLAQVGTDQLDLLSG